MGHFISDWFHLWNPTTPDQVSASLWCLLSLIREINHAFLFHSTTWARFHASASSPCGAEVIHSFFWKTLLAARMALCTSLNNNTVLLAMLNTHHWGKTSPVIIWQGSLHWKASTWLLTRVTCAHGQWYGRKTSTLCSSQFFPLSSIKSFLTKHLCTLCLTCTPCTLSLTAHPYCWIHLRVTPKGSRRAGENLENCQKEAQSSSF